METSQDSTETAATEVFKALGDPVRWSIVAQIAAVDELPCADLEQTLPVSKPTISYHTKILQQAGLLSVRKSGRNYFYALRRDVLRDVLDDLWRLAPAPRPVRDTAEVEAPVPSSRRRSERQVASQPRPHRRDRRARRASGDDEMVVLTW